MLFIRSSSEDSALMAVAGAAKAAQEARMQFATARASNDGKIAVAIAAASAAHIVVLETTHFGPAALTALAALPAPRRATLFGFGVASTQFSHAVGANGTTAGLAIARALATPPQVTLVCIVALDILNVFNQQVCNALQKAHNGTFYIATLDVRVGTREATSNLQTVLIRIPASDMQTAHFVCVGPDVAEVLLAQPLAASTSRKLVVVKPGKAQAVEFAAGAASRISMLVDVGDYNQGYAVAHAAALFDRTKNLLATNLVEFGPYIYTTPAQLPPRYVCSLLMGDYVLCPSARAFPPGCGCVNRSAHSIVTISHGSPDVSAFWQTNKRGFASYMSLLRDPPAWTHTFLPVYAADAYAALVNTVLDGKPDGLIASGPSDVVGAAFIANSSKARFFTTFNSETANWPQWGALAHIAQREFSAGFALGERMRVQLGVTSAICAIHTRGTQNLIDRCAGFSAGIFPGNSTVLYVTGSNNIPALQQQLRDFLANTSASASIRGWQALNADGAAYTADVMAEIRPDIKVQGFDVSSPALERLIAGTDAAHAHQQPFAQAYISLMYMQLAVLTSQPLTTKLVESGPTMVTASNAAAYACEAEYYPMCPPPRSTNAVSVESRVDLILVEVLAPVLVAAAMVAAARILYSSFSVVRFAPKNPSEPYCIIIVGPKNAVSLSLKRSASVAVAVTAFHAALVRSRAKYRCHLVRRVGDFAVMATRDVKDAMAFASAVNKIMADVAETIPSDASHIVHGHAPRRPLFNVVGSDCNESPADQLVASVGVHLGIGTIVYEKERSTYVYDAKMVRKAAKLMDAAGPERILVSNDVVIACTGSRRAAGGGPLVPGDFEPFDTALEDETGAPFDASDYQPVGGTRIVEMTDAFSGAMHVDSIDCVLGAVAALEQCSHELAALGGTANVFSRRRCSVMVIRSALLLTDVNRDAGVLTTLVFQSVRQHHGVVETPHPNLFYVSFGAHASLDSHEKEALACAQDISRQLNRQPLRNRCRTFIGIHSGDFLVGTSGVHNHRQRVVFGEGFDFLAKLPSLCFDYVWCTILVSDTVVGGLRDPTLCPIDIVRERAVSTRALGRPIILYTTVAEAEVRRRVREAFMLLVRGEFDAVARGLTMDVGAEEMQLLAHLRGIGVHLALEKARADSREGSPRAAVVFQREERPLFTALGNAVLPPPGIADHATDHALQTAATLKPNPLAADLEDNGFFAMAPTVEIRSPTSSTPSCSNSVSGALFAVPPRRLVDPDGVQWTRSAKEIGKGTFSVVYKAISDSGSQCAMKCFDRTRRHTDDAAIAEEIKLCSSLHHENIVRFHSCVVTGNFLCVLMELMPGGSLFDVLSAYGTLSFPTVRNFAGAALRGLAYLHARGVVHCDVKPHNLLVGLDSVLKLADFGSALNHSTGTPRDAADGEDKEGGFVIRGSAPYMAPEVANGEKPTAASDIFSFGVTLCELVTGKMPWQFATSRRPRAESSTSEGLGGCEEDHNAETKIALLMRNDAAFIRKIGRGDVVAVPPAGMEEGFRSVAVRCFERDPALRPTSEELLHAASFVV